MKLASKRVIRQIGASPEDVSKIELIVATVGGFADNVPAVCYKTYDSAGKQIDSDRVVCRGYWRPGKWKARQVASEVWAYYTSRGIEASIRDHLA